MLPLGATITLILFIVPGYLLSIFSSFRGSSVIERVYFSFVLSLAISILVGLVLSYCRIFTPFWSWIFLLLYNILSITFYIVYKVFSKTAHTNKEKRYQIDAKITFLTILALLICFAYTQQSPFPIGWDRGKHLGRSISTLRYGMLETTHPGTNHDPFYFQGPNIVLSIFTGSTYLISNLSPTIKIPDFDSLVELSITFKFFYTLLISLTALSIYCVSISNSQNEKIGVLSSLILVSLLGFNIAGDASIGTILSLISLGILYIYLNFLGRRNLNHFDFLFISIVMMSIIFTHVVGGVFMTVSIILALWWKYSKRIITSKQIHKAVILMIVSIGFSLSFLSVFYHSLFEGILAEIYRNPHTSRIGGSFGITLKEYFTQNAERILYGGGGTALIPLILSAVGFLLDMKSKHSIIVPITCTSILFTFIRILPYVKPHIYLMYPLCLLSALSLFHILNIFKSKNRVEMTIRIIVFTYLIVAAAISAKTVLELGSRRQRWYGEDTYREIYDLSVWLDKELDSDHVILFPYAGSHAHLLSALSSNKMFFAEPRFPDLPSYQETSRIYQKYPTSTGFFDYSNVSDEERRAILSKYNISVIFESRYVKVDAESLKPHYSRIEVSHPTPSYWVVILDEEGANEDTAG